MAYRVEFDLTRERVRVWADWKCGETGNCCLDEPLVFDEDRIAGYLAPLVGKNVCFERVEPEGPILGCIKANGGRLERPGKVSAGILALITEGDADYYPVFEVLDRGLGTQETGGSLMTAGYWNHGENEWALVALYEE